MENVNSPKPEKPKTLNRPLRKFVKRNGKKAMRWAARFQSKQSLVPDTPFIDTSHFPFLSEFEDQWEVMRDE